MKMSDSKLRYEKITELKKIVNVNFAVSYFIPVIINDNMVDTAFLYSSTATVKERTRPFAKVMFEHSSGNLLEYKNSYICDYMNSDKYPMTTKINYSLPSEISAIEYGEIVKKVNSYYDMICEFAYKAEVAEENKEKIREYKSLFYASVPEALLPYYEALSPEFFEWLNSI